MRKKLDAPGGALGSRVAAGELKSIYGRRIDAFEAGLIDPDPDLIEATRQLVERLSTIDDSELLTMGSGNGFVRFSDASGDQLFGELPLLSTPTTSRDGVARLVDVLIAADEQQFAIVASRAHSGDDDTLREFLVSNTLWGGAGSIADQAGVGSSREQKRRRIETALIDLGRLQLDSGVVNERTAMWIDVFERWRASGI